MPPSEHELRLRERLSRLRNMPLLGGAKLSGELERLQRQLDRHRRGAGDRRGDLALGRARAARRPAVHARLRGAAARRLVRAARRPRPSPTTARWSPASASSDGRTVALVGQQKGRDIQERATRQFGMPYPEGYRKAIRVMELADLHGFPVISLIDTPGAYPGVAAEQHGQGGAIAASQAAMARLHGADRRLRDRRGRLRRRDRDRPRRPRADAGARDLLGDLAGRLRRHPLARRRRGEEGGRRLQARRGALPRARRDRRDRAGAGGRGAHRPRRGGAAAAAPRCARRSTSWPTSRATSSGAGAGRKFRSLGVFA